MSRPRAWWLVMLGRVVVLAVLAGAAFALVRSSGPPGARYVCPMHPDVRLAEPGVCPICQMALVEDGAQVQVIEPRAPLTATVELRTFAELLRVPAWVEAGRVTAIVYRDDLVGAVTGEPASFAPASAPGAPIDVTLSNPAGSPWDRATARLQFDGAGLPPGEEGTLVLPARPRAIVVVPTSALLACPDGPCVVVLEPTRHRFVRRTVETGRAHLGTTAVLAGLTAGERVAVESAFFLATEHAP